VSALKTHAQDAFRVDLLRYFHGGRPGLHVGDVLTPASERQDTEALTMIAQDIDHAEKAKADPSFVYISTRYDIGMFYAKGFPPKGGAVYAVVPFGPLEDDPDFKGPSGVSLRCRAATIVRVLDKQVKLFTPEEFGS